MPALDAEAHASGRLSLDLTWTLRYRAVAPTETLLVPADLGRWVSSAVAPVRGTVPSWLLDEAIRLREAIHDAATAAIDGRAATAADRRLINRWAEEPGPVHRLEPQGRTTVRLRPGAGIESALAAVAADAVDVLSAADGRLRRCEGPHCSLVFYDASRPGRRRWCSTARCGNRVNTTNYRRRQADAVPRP